MNRELDIAIELRKSGKHKESNQLLLNIVQDFPEDASINYHCAWSFDLLGEDQKQCLFMKRQSNWVCLHMSWKEHI